MPDRPRVGFIGLGNMGWPMATNIARAGFRLTVLDVDRERQEQLAKTLSCGCADDLAALGKSADVVVTMLPTGLAVRKVLLEMDGGALSQSLARGSIVVDMSSSEPVGTQELGTALAALGITLIDAPVSGGVPRAETGKLAIMIGSYDKDAVTRVEPILQAMGDRLFRTGQLGSGHAMKALNNFIAATGFTAAAEALIVGRRFGLDPNAMFDIFNASTGRNFATENVIPPHVLTRAFKTGFAVGLLAKDVRIAADLGEAIGIDAPLSRLIRKMWAEASDGIGAGEDHSAAIKHWEAATAIGRRCT